MNAYWNRTMKMKKISPVFSVAIVIVLLISLMGCGGVQKVNTDLHIPEMDRSQYSDSNYQTGWQKLKEGKPDEALEFFQKSSVAEEILHLGYGYVYLAQKKLALARKNFQKAMTINPENMQAQFGMATLHESLDEKEEAFIIYSRLLTKYPENAWVKVRYEYIKSVQTQYYLKQAELYKNQNENPAYIEALKKAIQYSPNITDIKMELADFLNTQEQFESAAKYYEMVLENLSNNAEVMVKLAKVYEGMKKFDASVMIYKKILEQKPGDLDILNKINDLKIKFYDWNLPVKFKNIFFKEEITREELAALLGYYFEKWLEPRPPVIITDIGGSFAKEYIIKICTLDIMKLRPDHSFGRFPKINRGQVAVVIDALIKYLEKSESGAYTIQFTPLEEVIEPADISPLHKNYNIIKFLVNSKIMKLDEENMFNPMLTISPAHVLEALKKILNSIRER
jgi:tetratricopeptide (TPR) repeat protein